MPGKRGKKRQTERYLRTERMVEVVAQVAFTSPRLARRYVEAPPVTVIDGLILGTKE